MAELIGKGTVNTIPEDTLKAFMDHGEVKEALTGEASAARKVIAELKDAGIDINDICAKLLQDGVGAFEKSFTSLLQSIEKKASQLCKT